MRLNNQYLSVLAVFSLLLPIVLVSPAEASADITNNENQKTEVLFQHQKTKKPTLAWATKTPTPTQTLTCTATATSTVTQTDTPTSTSTPVTPASPTVAVTVMAAESVFEVTREPYQDPNETVNYTCTQYTAVPIGIVLLSSVREFRRRRKSAL